MKQLSKHSIQKQKMHTDHSLNILFFQTIVFYSEFGPDSHTIIKFDLYHVFIKLWPNYQNGMENWNVTFCFELSYVAKNAQYLQIEASYHSKAEKICYLW